MTDRIPMPDEADPDPLLENVRQWQTIEGEINRFRQESGQGGFATEHAPPSSITSVKITRTVDGRTFENEGPEI